MRSGATGEEGAGTVSVIIVNFNAKGTLPACLAALKAQSLKAERVIIVDNASTDGSIENANVLFPEFEYVYLPANTGFAAANNRAIECCDSEFVALLNPDAFPEPTWLDELVKAARLNPGAASFGSCQLMADRSDVIDGIGDVCHISGLVWREGHGRSLNGSDSTAREIFSPCAAAALYRRQAMEVVGGFDEDFFCYIEDVDLGFRLRLCGWQSWYVPSAVVRHVGSGTTGGARSKFSVYYGHRNLVWMFVKNMPGCLFWLFLPLHLAMNLVCIVWFVLHGQAGTIFRAKWDAISGLPKIWQKRLIVQRQRTLPASVLFSVLSKSLGTSR